MSCLLSSGINDANVCRKPAGVVEFILINKVDVSDVDHTNFVLTTLTLATSKYGYKFTTKPEMTDYSVKSIGSSESGGHGYETTFKTKLFSNDGTIIALMDTLAKGQYYVAIKNNDGTYELLGYENGLTFSVERMLEAKYDGFNGYNISATFRSDTPQLSMTSQMYSAIPLT